MNRAVRSRMGPAMLLQVITSGWTSEEFSDYAQRNDIIGAELCHFEHNICNKRPMPREEPK